MMNISGASGLAGLFSGNGRKLSLDVGELFKEVFEDEQIAAEEAAKAAAETENEANRDFSDNDAVLEAGFREAIYNWKSRFAELYEEEEEDKATEVEANSGQHVDAAGVTIAEAPSDGIVAGANPANNRFAGLNENGTEKTVAAKTVHKTAGLFEDEEEAEKTDLTSSLFGNSELDDEFLNIVDEMQLTAAAEMQQTLRLRLGKGASLQDSGMILNDLGMRYPNTQAWLASRERAYAKE